MKLHHAAVLALGWYIMVPPIAGPSFHVDPHAPISQWIVEFSFDTAIECEQGISTFQNERLSGEFTGIGDTLAASQALKAKCIASDDPRLKPKCP
jgi:hypothetical protein